MRRNVTDVIFFCPTDTHLSRNSALVFARSPSLQVVFFRVPFDVASALPRVPTPPGHPEPPDPSGLDSPRSIRAVPASAAHAATAEAARETQGPQGPADSNPGAAATDGGSPRRPGVGRRVVALEAVEQAMMHALDIANRAAAPLPLLEAYLNMAELRKLQVGVRNNETAYHDVAMVSWATSVGSARLTGWSNEPHYAPCGISSTYRCAHVCKNHCPMLLFLRVTISPRERSGGKREISFFTFSSMVLQFLWGVAHHSACSKSCTRFLSDWYDFSLHVNVLSSTR